ncbi:MAG: nucleotidyltransferase domain-containing protein [Candidatus Atribacteria bacterium]|nr:nucleotidyltransferase domain-containing protein [Candidatus Atribacteria bacterium]
MRQEFFSFPKKKRQRIIFQIREALEREPNIVFAYLFGSFLDDLFFRDIDIGIYLKSIKEEEAPSYEEKLAFFLHRMLRIPPEMVDTRVLNFVSSTFLGHVFCRGLLLFTRDEIFLTDLIERASEEMLADEHIARQSLRELVSR